MAEYLAPGVYIEEFPRVPQPIQGVPTSTAGMAGYTARGPLMPRLITSPSEYQQWFGGALDGAFLSAAIQGFFDNGGQRVFVARVVDSGSTTATLSVPTTGEPLILRAIGPGRWGNGLVARVRPGSRGKGSVQASRDCFRLTIELSPDVVEDYDNLTVDPNSPDHIATIVNEHSRLVSVAPGPVLPPIHVDEVTASGGFDGTPQASDVIGSRDVPVEARTGLAALEAIDDISILLVPDEVTDSSGTITNAVIDQCERRKDRFAIVSSPPQHHTVADLRPPRATSFAAFYYPWIRIIDGARHEAVLVPPGGHIAGLYVRTDVERGVHKAPANVVVRGLTAGEPGSGDEPLEFTLSDADQGILNPLGVNVIRDFRNAGRGVRVWGARTMAASDALWKYVNVRRLFIFVEESIGKGTQWVAFEPNREATWAAVRQVISDFLRRLWLDGALTGVTQDDAFFVTCDRTTMTQDDIDNGRLICLVGIAPVKPAEFVIVRISQMTAGSPA